MDASAPQDRNQRLAEQIGRARAENVSLEETGALDDELARVLVAYRHAVEADAPEPSPETSQRLWQRIASEIDERETSEWETGERETNETESAPRPARRADRPPMRRGPAQPALWRAAVAATVLVVAGVAAWLLLQPPAPTLVAEATTKIVTYKTADGSVVRLRPGSQLYRVDAEGATRVRLDGEAAFDVTPRADAPFEVEAGAARVRVLGTRFTVQTWTAQPVVFLEEGRVELRSLATDRAAVLSPGQTGTLTADGAVTTQAADPAPFVDWLDGQVVFDAQPAGEVARELEQHFGVQLRLPERVAQQTITGRLLLDDEAQALRDFATVLGGRFERQGTTYRFRPEG